MSPLRSHDSYSLWYEYWWLSKAIICMLLRFNGRPFMSVWWWQQGISGESGKCMKLIMINWSTSVGGKPAKRTCQGIDYILRAKFERNFKKTVKLTRIGTVHFTVGLLRLFSYFFVTKGSPLFGICLNQPARSLLPRGLGTPKLNKDKLASKGPRVDPWFLITVPGGQGAGLQDPRGQGVNLQGPKGSRGRGKMSP